MSTNYTEHYNLCQWEPADKVLREDFNADNAKLDAALAAQKTAIDAAQASADAAFRPSYHPIAVGGYYGNGAANRDINLGFRPRAVLVLESSMAMQEGAYQYSAMVVEGLNYAYGNPVTISDAGFKVYSSKSQLTNQSGLKYFYIAIR
jgi:hypothetical protein